MSHKVRTGILAKKNWKDADLFKMFHELTPAQMSFFRECVVQELGGKSSAFWGHQKIPFKIKHNCSKKDLGYFLESLNHPTHIFARKMSINKHAAGYGAAIGRAVVKVGKTVGRYAAKGAKWMAAHAKQIMGGLDTAIGLGVTGVNMAYQMGALDDESDATLLGLTQAVGMAHQLYHAGDGEEEEKKTDTSTKASEKTGKGGWAERTDHRFHSKSFKDSVAKTVAQQKAHEIEKHRQNVAFKQYAINFKKNNPSLYDKAKPVPQMKRRPKTVPEETSKSGGGTMAENWHKAALLTKQYNTEHTDHTDDIDPKKYLSHKPIDMEKLNKQRHDRRLEVDKPQWMQRMDHQLDIQKFKASHRGKHQIKKKAIY